MRVMVGKSPDPAMAAATTNTGTTAIVGGTSVLEPLQFNQVGTPNPIDYPISVSSDYKILYDKVYTSAPATGSTVVPIDFTVPLKLVRGYSSTGAPTEGSWFLYFTTPSGISTTFSGYVKLSYVSMSAGF